MKEIRLERQLGAKGLYMSRQQEVYRAEKWYDQSDLRGHIVTDKEIRGPGDKCLAVYLTGKEMASRKPEEEAPCLHNLYKDPHRCQVLKEKAKDGRQFGYTLEKCRLNLTEGCFLLSLLPSAYPNPVKKSISSSCLLTRNTSDVTAEESSFGIIPRHHEKLVMGERGSEISFPGDAAMTKKLWTWRIPEKPIWKSSVNQRLSMTRVSAAVFISRP